MRANLLVISLVAVLGVCVLLMLVTAGRRIQMILVDRRRDALEKPVRPLVLMMAADSDEDGEPYETLAAADPATWNAIEPLVVRVLGKVRGDARGSLIRLLEAHGAAERALNRLTKRGAVGRARAAETLGLLGAADAIPALCTCVTDRSADVREVAVRALGRIGEPSVAPTLLKALSGHHPIPPQAVVIALLRLGPGTAPDLVPSLQHDSDVVRAEVAETLGLMRAVSATQPLIVALAEDPLLEVRVRAARALGLIGHPHALAPLIEAVGAGQPPALRPVATAALGELGSAEAVPTLVELLGDPLHGVADAAAGALVQLGSVGLAALAEIERTARPASLPGRTVTGLNTLATDADPEASDQDVLRAGYAVAALSAVRIADL